MTAIEKDIKCVVWDLDETIWHGMLYRSDVVILKEGIKEIIQTLDSRGILQSIASRNNYDDAWEKLKEFELGNYFLYPEINWNAKSVSIVNIQKNLNISPGSILFIDDDHFERAEVTNTCCDVTCIDASEYQAFINQPGLNPRLITEDSKKRRLMYVQDVMRHTEENSLAGPSDKFLASLNMKLFISEAIEEDLQRAEELMLRSSQLNATGYVYSYNELSNFINSANHKLWICELTDNYGSYGKIGLALVELFEGHWHLKLLVVSCRVISRGIGTMLLNHIMQLAKNNNKTLLADFRKTDRNKMMYVTYKLANFREMFSNTDGSIVFNNDLSQVQFLPAYIELHS
jgi:FkbH-like protein